MLEMGQRLPEKLFDECGVTLFVGMGKSVSGRRSEPVAAQHLGLHTQPFANVVEPDGVGQLCEEHGTQMAEHAERARLGINPGFPGNSSNHPARNELEKLVKDDIIGSGWRLVIHIPYRVAGNHTDRRPNFSPNSENPMGC